MAAVQKTTLTVQVSKKAKARAQKAARARGVSVSFVVEEALGAFDDKAAEQKPLVPSKKLQKILREVDRDIQEGNTHKFSGPFTPEEFEQHLRGLMKK